MTTKTEGYHAEHFLVSEANGHRSRESVPIAAGEVLQAGAVIAKHPVTGRYYGYDNDGTSVTNAAAGVLLDNVDASAGVVYAAAIVRDAEVNLDELIFETTEDTGDKSAAVTDLKALGIICR